MIRKSIPNIITCTRLVGAICLIFIEPLTLAFYIVYSICGLSDALDGFTARRLKVTSRVGSILDSIADLSFYSIMLIRLFPRLYACLPRWIWYCVGAVLLVRLTSYIVAMIRLHRFSALHTILNKMTGGAVFAIPYFMKASFFTVYCFIALAIGGLSSGYDLYLNLTANPEENK